MSTVFAVLHTGYEKRLDKMSDEQWDDFFQDNKEYLEEDLELDLKKLDKERFFKETKTVWFGTKKVLSKNKRSIENYLVLEYLDERGLTDEGCICVEIGKIWKMGDAIQMFSKLEYCAYGIKNNFGALVNLKTIKKQKGDVKVKILYIKFDAESG